MRTVYFLDTTTRSLRLLACSATVTASGRFVLRSGAEVGRLDELFPAPTPTPAFYCGFGGPAGTLPVLLVPEIGYRAQSSAGFVNVRGGSGGSAGIVSLAATCGLQLFGRDKPESLRLLREPISCFVLADASIRRLRTHTNSNCETATAAYYGLEVRSQLVPNEIIVSEGQSDYTAAWAVRAGRGRGFDPVKWGAAEWCGALPEEHVDWVYTETRDNAEPAATVVEFDRY